MQTASVLSYQAVEVIAQALEEAGSADPDDVREAIAGISIDEPLLAFDGPIEFDETGQNTNATVVVMQVQGDKVEQVAPDEFMTSKAVYPTFR
jgi:branched-chain amino acid transport system substrate-binding protein